MAVTVIWRCDRCLFVQEIECVEVGLAGNTVRKPCGWFVGFIPSTDDHEVGVFHACLRCTRSLRKWGVELRIAEPSEKHEAGDR